jgi:endonuclease/exonuclease/phosphatase family metal-dependent hydrolase
LSYVGQLALAITRYRDFIGANPTIIVGDFNSNQLWDRKPRIGNHSWVVETLKQQGLVSVYHAWSGEAHGEETAKTWYMYRKRETIYHIDYCFVPQSWLTRLHSFAVGEVELWLALSDHLPLFVEFRGS